MKSNSTKNLIIYCLIRKDKNGEKKCSVIAIEITIVIEITVVIDATIMIVGATITITGTIVVVGVPTHL